MTAPSPLSGPSVAVGPDLVRVTAPAGWGDRAALSALRPALSRALAPPLPPAEHWPEHWREAYAERPETIRAALAGASPPTSTTAARST